MYPNLSTNGTKPTVALIGFGYWGRNLARVLAESRDFVLHTICDVSAQALERAGEIYPGVALARDPFQARLEACDVVAIATPSLQHFELSRHFLEAGKHLLVTKPFTSNAAQAERLYAMAEERDLAILVDYTFVFHPAVRKMKEMLPSVGKPYFILAQRMNLGLYQPDVNVIHDLLPHDLSIVSYLFDEPLRTARTTACRAAGLPQEDFAHVAFTLESGVPGYVSVSWLSPYKIRQFFVVGDRGMLCYDDTQVLEKIKFFDRGISVPELDKMTADQAYTSLISYRMGQLYSPPIPNEEALALELRELRALIDDRKRRIGQKRLALQVAYGLDKVLAGTVPA